MRAECEAAETSPPGNAKELLLSESQRDASGTQAHEFVIEINAGVAIASLDSSRTQASEESQETLDSSGFDRNSSGSSESEGNVCRVCHLSVAVELIELGCSCKGELGLVHQHCAQAWFKIKGNRICEICGQVAKNVVGTNELGRPSRTTSWTEAMALEFSASREERSFWRNRHLCHFIFSFLVVLVLLPWLFRLNLFKM